MVRNLSKCPQGARTRWISLASFGRLWKESPGKNEVTTQSIRVACEGGLQSIPWPAQPECGRHGVPGWRPLVGPGFRCRFTARGMGTWSVFLTVEEARALATSNRKVRSNQLCARSPVGISLSIPAAPHPANAIAFCGRFGKGNVRIAFTDNGHWRCAALQCSVQSLSR
jgi:hypothetical protein